MAELRRAFDLPSDDRQYLDSLGIPWETIEDDGHRWLLIADHPLPEGYTTAAATLAIRIEGGYPPGKLDMVYFHPPLERRDGKAIRKVRQQRIDSKPFQRWSRHYGWRDGVDDLSTHHTRIKKWLQDEPGRG